MQQLEELEKSEGKLMTEPEAAKKLKVSRLTLLRKRQNGDIGYFKLPPNRIYYAQRHLDAYLDGNSAIEVHPRSANEASTDLRPEPAK